MSQAAATLSAGAHDHHDQAGAQAPAGGQTLRDYQLLALDNLRNALARLLQAQRRPRVLLVSPTGSGKTTIAAAMIRSAVGRGHSVLFLAHRRELLDQCSERLDGVGIDHGIIQSGHPRELPGLPVQVASVQTLVKRTLQQAPRLIVIDEAHRARAKTYDKIIQLYPEAVIVGLTATPLRMDGRGLGELFEDLIEAETPAGLIERGHLVSYTGFAYDSPDCGKVKKRGADYDQAGLELVMGASKILGNIVEQWQAHAAGKRTVVFAVTVNHSLQIVDRFRAAGVAAEHVDGETPTQERAAILGRLRSGETTVVSNVAIITEGFDLPALEVCVLARPTQSLTLYLQMVGRVLRPAPGKAIARIHDHGRCFMEHGAPDAERVWALDYDVERRKGLKAPPLRTCSYCLRVFDPQLGDACPSCGRVNPPAARQIIEVTKDVRAIPLHELPQNAGATDDEKRRWYDKQLIQQYEKGYKKGWAVFRFKARFGDMPPRDWPREFVPAPAVCAHCNHALGWAENPCPHCGKAAA